VIILETPEPVIVEVEDDDETILDVGVADMDDVGNVVQASGGDSALGSKDGSLDDKGAESTVAVENLENGVSVEGSKTPEGNIEVEVDS